MTSRIRQSVHVTAASCPCAQNGPKRCPFLEGTPACTSRAGNLTYRMIPVSQWRDRAGFAPASPFYPCAHDNLSLFFMNNGLARGTLSR